MSTGIVAFYVPVHSLKSDLVALLWRKWAFTEITVKGNPVTISGIVF